MSLGKCFLATRNVPAEKQLRCISCHDPHVEPTGEEAPAHFNSACLACHTKASCTAPHTARPATTPSDNCIGCHMPLRSIRVISHSTATNHRIVRTPEEPFPDQTFNQTTAAMPDLIELNPAGERGAGALVPSALIRLQAYPQLNAEGKAQFIQPWLKTLAELETTDPESAMVRLHWDIAIWMTINSPRRSPIWSTLCSSIRCSRWSMPICPHPRSKSASTPRRFCLQGRLSPWAPSTPAFERR